MTRCHATLPVGREAPRDPQALAGLPGRVGAIELEVQGVLAGAQRHAHLPGVRAHPAAERLAQRRLDLTRADGRPRGQLAHGRQLHFDTSREAGLLEAQIDADMVELLGRGHRARAAQAVGQERAELGQHVASGVRVFLDVARGGSQHVVDEVNGDGWDARRLPWSSVVQAE